MIYGSKLNYNDAIGTIWNIGTNYEHIKIFILTLVLQCKQILLENSKH